VAASDPARREIANYKSVVRQADTPQHGNFLVKTVPNVTDEH
jgi:hypothetical protein